jgi:hypothetical protein
LSGGLGLIVEIGVDTNSFYNFIVALATHTGPNLSPAVVINRL